jgi:hypothetical protein
MTATAAAPGVGELLTRLAQELSTLQSIADEIETSVGQLLERDDAAITARGVQKLQLLDILNQSLGALSTFCTNAAARAAPEWTIDAAAATRGIVLTRLAERLAGESPRASEDGWELFPEG